MVVIKEDQKAGLRMKNTVLIKDSSSPTGFRMTRLQAHRRYVNTIKPIEDLLKYLEEDKDE